MTMVIAYHTVKATIIIADCRVSYGPRYHEVDDCLQKLYQIDDRLVMGFAGPLEGAFQVMDLVRHNASNYPQPATAFNLEKDVERWIRFKYRKLGERQRQDLSFMIATVEPGREKRAKWYEGGKEIPKPGWFPYVPEGKSFVLRPRSEDPSELVKVERGLLKLIGVAGEDSMVVRRVVQQHFSSSLKEPELHMQVVMNHLKLELLRRKITSIGGLFQSALLDEQGIRWLGYGGTGVVLDLVQGRFVQRNIATGATLPLVTLWEWATLRPKPGSFGTFEDQGLLEAIENLRVAETQNKNGRD